MSINDSILFSGAVLMSRIGQDKRQFITGRKMARVKVCADSPVTTVRPYVNLGFWLIDKEAAP